MSGLFWAALTVRDHLWHRRNFAGRLSVIRANLPNYRIAESRGPPASLLFRTGPSQVIPIKSTIEEQVAWLDRFRPEHLLTYPNNLEALARHCERRGAAFPGLGHVRTIGEALSPGARAIAGLRVVGDGVADQRGRSSG